MISERMGSLIREIPDFPRKGVIFKDITPILKDVSLCKEMSEAMVKYFKDIKIDGVACLESRGFWFGMLISQMLNVPFIPMRKKGKLPGTVVTCNYNLEYGTACLEMHADAIHEGDNILIHDDVLATGGTASAASQLIEGVGAKVAGFAFLLELSALEGRKKIDSSRILSLLTY
ncbi:MAG TPA: adenine phosphoribosyltransferase [Cytophagaceae bacterium]|jgi:adenine phosphoribosyltransferase